MSLSNYGEKYLLEKLPEKVWIKLHTGDPGEECTSNAAGETTRKEVTLATPSGETRKSSTAIEWTNVSTAETYKYVSAWDASTNGNAFGSGAFTAEKTVAVGDNFLVKSGELEIKLD